MGGWKWIAGVALVALAAGCSGNRAAEEASALEYFKRGNVAFQKEDYRHAIRMYEQAGQLDPRSPGIQYNLGLAFYEAQAYPESVQAYTRALKLNPKFADAHRNLALAEDRLYHWDAAQEHYTLYLAMVRDQLAVQDAAKSAEAKDGATASAPPAPPSKSAASASQKSAKPGAKPAAKEGLPEPISQLRRFGNEGKTIEPSAKSGDDGKWWTQDSAARK